MTATVIQFPKPLVPAIRCADPVSESLAAFRLATLQAERLADELEKMEREIAEMLRDNPKVSL